MTTKEAVKQLKVLMKQVFNSQEFEAAKLSDGTAIEYTALEAGGEIALIAADGTKQPAPAGSHELEDGRIVVVVEPGKIAEVKEAEAPAPEEQEMEKHPDYTAQIAALEKENTDLKTRLEALEKGAADFKKQTGELLTSFQTALEAVAEEETAPPINAPKQTIFSDQKDKKDNSLKKFSAGVEAYKKKLATQQ